MLGFEGCRVLGFLGFQGLRDSRVLGLLCFRVFRGFKVTEKGLWGVES